MFELLTLGAAGFVGIWSHQSTKDFVRRRLRFTKVVDNGPAVALLGGAATGIATAVGIAALPILGLGTGLVLGVGTGVGVATGIATGSSHARRGYLPEED
jgi:hypothetical protein